MLQYFLSKAYSANCIIFLLNNWILFVLSDHCHWEVLVLKIG